MRIQCKLFFTGMLVTLAFLLVCCWPSSDTKIIIIEVPTVPTAPPVVEPPVIPEPPKPPVLRTHTVVSGDTLWGISKKYLGDAHRWPEIWQLNKDKICNPHWIYPGQVLVLP